MWWTWWTVAWAAPQVVMVGNSYMQRNDLPAQLRDRLGDVIPAGELPETVDLALPGRTWAQHVERLDDGDTFSAAFGAPRDVVVLQEQSQTPGFPQQDGSWVASTRAGLALHQAGIGIGAVTVLMNTWGRRDGDGDNPALYPDYITMQERLDAGYRAYQDGWEAETGVRPTRAPVGDAWRAVWELDPGAAGFRALYDGDGSHPSAAGSLLTSYVLSASITGYGPVGGGETIEPAVRDQLAAIAAGVVFDDPWGEDAFPWAWEWSAWVVDHGQSVTGTWQRPWVRLGGELELATPVRIGEAVGAIAGAGRLVVPDDARVTLLAPVTVGAGGTGEVEIAGGSVSAARFVLGEALGARGDLLVSGGQLDAAWIDRGFGEGAVRVSGGVLALSGPCGVSITVEGGELQLQESAVGMQIGGDLDVAGGAVRWAAPVIPEVGGAIRLSGSLELAAEHRAGDVLARANTITVTELTVSTAAGEPASVTVEEDGARQRLVVGGAAAVGDDVSPEVACGCGHGGPTARAWGLGLLAASWRRRRAG